ncbi:helix-turn-helix domain-containing protein [Streptococcus pluranimalium]|uniref:helix-turn-helix domain-containing protein n=1 Tax=Streptococcus pluranimalium TaxID=82348 RepID=UPI003F681B0E
MFSQKLKELRTTNNLSQKQIAEKMNISQQAYSKWESGKNSPSLATLEKVANFFNLSIEELLTDGTTSIENLLNAETITYQGKILSPEDTSKIKEGLKIILSKID